MSIFNKLFGNNAEQSETLIDVASSQVRRGKYKEAEKTLNKAIKVAPSYAKPHRYLGNLYEKMKRDRDAINEYEKAIKLEPDHAEYHNQLASVLFRQKRFKEAEKELRRNIEIDPESEDGHANLGALLLNMKKYTEAEHELRKAIQINPAVGNTHRHLSVVLYDTDQIDEALHELETAVDIYVKDGQTNLAKQLGPVILEMRAKIRKQENVRSRRIPKASRIHTIDSWNENHSKANQVLKQLFDIYTDRAIQPKKIMEQLSAAIEKNRSIIFDTEEFSELLESEIENTVQDGPVFMALKYMEIRWLITGREDHHREMDEYTEKVKNMDFWELTDTDL